MVFRRVSRDHRLRDVVDFRMLKKIMLRSSMLPLVYSALLGHHFFLFFNLLPLFPPHCLGSNILVSGVRIYLLSGKMCKLQDFYLPFCITFPFWGQCLRRGRSLHTLFYFILLFAIE